MSFFQEWSTTRELEPEGSSLVVIAVVVGFYLERVRGIQIKRHVVDEHDSVTFPETKVLGTPYVLSNVVGMEHHISVKTNPSGSRVVSSTVRVYISLTGNSGFSLTLKGYLNL